MKHESLEIPNLKRKLILVKLVFNRAVDIEMNAVAG